MRRGGFQRHNNMVIGLRHDPGSVCIVHGAGSFHKPSIRGMPWGLARQNPKVPAVPPVLSGCVVAMKNPHAPVLQSGASLSFPFLAVMPFAGFPWGIFGERP